LLSDRADVVGLDDVDVEGVFHVVRELKECEAV
jgi:hypothetical protein